MIRSALLPIIILLFSINCASQVYVSSSSGAVSGVYGTIKLAFDRINDGTHQGTIVLTVGDANGQTITETSEAVLNKSGTGLANYTGVTIYPGAENIKITSVLSGGCCLPTGTIKLNQANNVVIDGRISGVGNNINLTIENTAIASWGVALILINASNNSMKYLNLSSSVTGTSGGVGTLSFKDNNAAGGDPGCDNNIVEHCVFSNAGSTFPLTAIAGDGVPSTSEIHENNTIRNCVVKNFQNKGIWLSGGSGGGDGGNRNWIIENNEIYQASVFATMSYDQIGICIGLPFSTSDSEQGTFIIRNNQIGGDGSGGKWKASSTLDRKVAAICINTWSSDITNAGYSKVDGNIIKDFEISTGTTNTTYGLFTGILVTRGKVEIGVSSGNSIGSFTDGSSIILSRSITTNFTNSAGIQVESPMELKNKIMNNNVGGFTLTSGSGNFSNFYGIRNFSATTYPQDSVFKNNVSYITVSKVNYFNGIYGSGFISKNRVRDIDFTGASTFSEMKGIAWYGGDASDGDFRGVENNEIILGKNRLGTSVGINDVIIGIHITRGNARSFHNSVLIEGTHQGSENTIGMLVSWSGTIEIHNNVLYNSRTGGTGKHFAISRTGTGVSFQGSNNAFVIEGGLNNIMGSVSGVDKSVISDWQASVVENSPLFDFSSNRPIVSLFPLIAQDSLDVPSPTWLTAGLPSVVDTDIRSSFRSITVPTIGAYEPNQALAVELLYFNGTQQNADNVLYWSTSSEKENSHFVVQCSADATLWETISMVDGAGYSDVQLFYSFVHRDPYPKTYYRLIQVDFNGNESISQIVFISREGINISVYPNPSKGFFYVNLPEEDIKSLIISICDGSGRIISSLNYVEILNGTYEIDGSLWQKGIYYLRIEKYDEIENYKLLLVE
ncbi:MAG: T9SS type A sorting domain-containing protein [Bacteroidetes bacterium]|nr:MAG: T9SS type A sorting domain-containing protein [Bacteroidota bacterium]